jgi:hypothetical protein
MPPWLATSVSWTALGVGVVVLLGGALLSAWSARVIDIDSVALPVLERTVGVRPPRSYVGLDDVVLPDLERHARDRRSQRDWGLEAVAWRRVLQKDPEHAAGKARFAKLLKLLGEARTVADVLK